MDLIHNNKNFLNLLCSSKKKVRKLLIQNATRDQINAIREIILNVLNGNLKIEKSDLEKLARKKNRYVT